jgi:hypothetical protein
MGLKQATRLTEGPMDFVRGAAGAAGQKIAQSGVGRAVGDVVNAGRQASTVGDLQQEIMKFAKLMARVDQLKGSGQRQEPTLDQPTQQQSSPAEQPQQPSQSGGVAQAFRTQGKPKMNPKHGGSWTFDSFLADLYSDGQHLDEGMWDFAKGAGREAWNKAVNKVKEYGDRPSMLKDLYHAGRQASQEGDARKATETVKNAKTQALQQLAAVLAQFQKVGPQASRAALQAVVSKLGPSGQRVVNVITANAAKRGIQL